MRIIAIFTGEGFTKDMYEQLRREVGWDTDQIDGWLMHIVGFDEADNIRMINVWESRNHMREAFDSRLRSVMIKVGVPEPHVEIYPLHNLSAFTATP